MDELGDDSVDRRETAPLIHQRTQSGLALVLGTAGQALSFESEILFHGERNLSIGGSRTGIGVSGAGFSSFDRRRLPRNEIGLRGCCFV
jgi:hypothetical protein